MISYFATIKLRQSSPNINAALFGEVCMSSAQFDHVTVIKKSNVYEMQGNNQEPVRDLALQNGSELRWYLPTPYYGAFTN